MSIGLDLATVLKPVHALGAVVNGRGRAVEDDGHALLNELDALQPDACNHIESQGLVKCVSFRSFLRMFLLLFFLSFLILYRACFFSFFFS